MSNHQEQKITLVLATRNRHKVEEMRAILSEKFRYLTLTDFPEAPAVPEDACTFAGNATKKAARLAEWLTATVPGFEFGVPGPKRFVLADDSGLEVAALNGAPGVHSARYAADEPHLADTNTDDEANNARVLRELRDVVPDKRTARFVCVLAAARNGKTLATFRGTAYGMILDAPRGTNGFGYDPLFYFPGIQKTFAELSAEEKARYSHRGSAFRQFLEWYEKQFSGNDI